MPLIINAGSGAIPEAGDGWTNSHEGAVAHAREWHDRMIADGIQDVDLLLPGTPVAGRWVFGFRHRVTGVTVDLETHGIDDIVAYERDRIFAPKIYWNGSSVGEPDVADWLADGFEVVKTLRPAAMITNSRRSRDA